MTKNQKRDIIEHIIVFIIFLLFLPVLLFWELAKDVDSTGRIRRRRR